MNALTILPSLLPFIYFSMYQDILRAFMKGYILMVIATSLLVYYGRVLDSWLDTDSREYPYFYEFTLIQFKNE